MDFGIKELRKDLEKISKRKDLKEDVKEKVKRVLNNEKEFLKFYLKSIGATDDLRKDVVQSVILHFENEKKSVLNNLRISKKKQRELIKEKEEYEERHIRALKEFLKGYNKRK